MKIKAVVLNYLLLILFVTSQVHGKSVLSETGFIEYYEGRSNLIISVPHGGEEQPSDIPNREAGCFIDGECVYEHNCGTVDKDKCRVSVGADVYTIETARVVSNALKDDWQMEPHLIINNLHRVKCDINRDKQVAAFGDPVAESVWEEYHGLINQTRAAMSKHALYIDLHGVSSHPEEWIELGYVIVKDNLNSGDYTYADSSIRNLAEVLGRTEKEDFDWLLSGNGSMGWLFEEKEHIVVPSPSNPTPGDGGYFAGNIYSTRMYGSLYGGHVDGIQIELPLRLRNEEECETFCPQLAEIIHNYHKTYFSSAIVIKPFVSWLAVSYFMLFMV